MAIVPCGATYDVTTKLWSFTGTQNPGGNRYAAHGPTTFDFTIAVTPADNTISLAPDPDGKFLDFLNGQPSFLTVTQTSDTTFSIEDSAPPESFGGSYGFLIIVDVNGTIIDSPDPIIINKDPDATMLAGRSLAQRGEVPRPSC
jgi:hypothetical protein